MKFHLLFVFSVILMLLVSGCSAPSSSSTSVTTPAKVPTLVKTSFSTPVHTSTTSFVTVIPSPKITTAESKATSTFSGGICDCSSDKLNCKDFSTHAEAQTCYDYCIGQGKGDIHRLDADQNGNACESL